MKHSQKLGREREHIAKSKVSCLGIVLGRILFLSNLYVLMSNTSGLDLIWRQGLYKSYQVKIQSFGWALIQYDCSPSTKGGLETGMPTGRGHVKMEARIRYTKDCQPTAREPQMQPTANTFISDFWSPKLWKNKHLLFFFFFFFKKSRKKRTVFWNNKNSQTGIRVLFFPSENTCRDRAKLVWDSTFKEEGTLPTRPLTLNFMERSGFVTYARTISQRRFHFHQVKVTWKDRVRFIGSLTVYTQWFRDNCH